MAPTKSWLCYFSKRQLVRELERLDMDCEISVAELRSHISRFVSEHLEYAFDSTGKIDIDHSIV